MMVANDLKLRMLVQRQLIRLQTIVLGGTLR